MNKNSLYICLAMSISSTSLANDDKLIEEAKKLINNGKPNAAYILLEKRMNQLSGKKEFDYFLGLSALQSDRPGEAIFALTRAVTTDPKFGGAKVDLARAYYNVSAYKESKGEFEEALALNPPAETRGVIKQYLTAIDQNLKTGPSYKLDFELGSGFDSNVNSATDELSYGPWVLSETSRARNSTVQKFSTTASTTIPVNNRWSTELGTYLARSSYPDAAFVNSDVGVLFTSLSRNTYSHHNALRLQHHRFFLANQLDTAKKDENNFGTKIHYQYGYRVSKLSRVNSEVSFGQLRFAEEFKTRNVDQVGVNLGWNQFHRSDTQWSHSIALAMGQDNAVENKSPYGKDYGSVNLSAQLGTNLKTSLIFNASYMIGKFHGGFLNTDLSSSSRLDRVLGLTAGTHIRPIRNWAIRPMVSYSKQSSTIDLYDYERLNVVVNLRYTMGS
ncbi:MAG: hypothetical protein OEX00_09585 [Gammaproteobacteria bacterium]|nr:hypothetical protein [Gammaproteobacteria bacterium]MDH5693456.1 hypothetical protein [Gammaproteobacteria bacterium]